MRPSEAAKIVAMLATAWPDWLRFLDDDQQEATRKLWRDFLADLDYVVADAALKRLIGTHTKPPAIAQFRATCSAYTEGRREHGGEAWGALLKLIGRWGMNRTPLPPSSIPMQGDSVPALIGEAFHVADPVLYRVIDALGWRELCTSEDQTADRARVIQLYDQLAQEDATERSVRAIAPPIPSRGGGGAPAQLGAIVAGMLPSKVPT